VKCTYLWDVSEASLELFLKQRTFSFHFAVAYFSAAVIGE